MGNRLPSGKKNAPLVYEGNGERIKVMNLRRILENRPLDFRFNDELLRRWQEVRQSRFHDQPNRYESLYHPCYPIRCILRPDPVDGSCQQNRTDSSLYG